MRIYLAGGFRSGWQDRVLTLIGDASCTIIDPREGDVTEPYLYTPKDLGQILLSDMVLLYLENSNPGGENAIFEAGVAIGLGKRLVFVNEWARLHDRYISMILHVAEFTTRDLDTAVFYIKGQL